MKKIMLVLLMLFVFGCASAIEKGLDKEMGKMTYDSALRQWGAPESIIDGNDVFVAVWNGKSNTSMRENANDYVLQLTFDKNSKIMKAWKFNEY